MSPRAILYLTIGGVCLVFVILGIVVSIVEAGRNYVLFDSHGDEAHGRIDGTDVGSVKKPSSIRVMPGSHKFEIVDGTGKVVATATAEVPAKAWRGVLSSQLVGHYAVVTVTYDSTSKPDVKRLERQGSSLHVITNGGITEFELNTLGETFPATAKKNSSSTKLCRIDTNGHAECLR
jgi:hypothetical protein